LDDTQGEGEVISVGLNQKIDAAAMELYVTCWNVSGKSETAGLTGGDATTDLKAASTSLEGSRSPEDLNVIMMGARIQF
jgi:hypothetical protein